MAARLFNGLTRREVRQLILMEVKSHLAERFAEYGDAPAQVQYDWTCAIAAYPAEDATFQVHLTGAVSASSSLVPDLLVKELDRHLDADTRFAGHLTFPKVSWDWHLDLTKAGPAAPRQGPKPLPEPTKHYDLRPLSVEPIRDVTQPSESALADPHAAGAKRAQTRMLAQGVNDTASPAPDMTARNIASTREQLADLTAAQPSALESRLDRLERMIEQVLTQKTQPAVIHDAGIIHPPAVSHVLDNVPNYTPTGLKIVGGAKESPGVEAAASYGHGAPIGTAQTLEAVERIALASDHPSIDQGGIGAPDAVRRAAGLPIPTRTEVKGVGLVDLPLGSF